MMRFWTILLAVPCILLGGADQRVAAQVALPQVQLPDAARTLPSLPDVDAQPLISAGDRLTGSGSTGSPRSSAATATASTPTIVASLPSAGF
jgi:hypothetical protein